MPKHNHHHDSQNKNPKRMTKKALVKVQRIEEISNTTIFELGFKSEIQEDEARMATPDSELVKLGKQCLEWANGPTQPLKIRAFFRDRNYDYEDIERFRRKSPLFSRYYEMALDVIGDRREAGAYNKKASENIVAFTMSLYDPDWRKLREEKAALAQAEASKSTGNITVQLLPVESCSEVPTKKGEDV